MGRGARFASFLLTLLLPLAPARSRTTRDDAPSACDPRSESPRTFFRELGAGAFPGSGPDAAIHVPAGFDPTARAGLVVYFHGWNSCVQAALGDADVPCSDGGEPRPASHLASQLDEAHVNALLVAVELRADLPTGETGQLASVGGLRALLGEALDDVRSEVGPLPLDGFAPIVLVEHSGGYQALAAALVMGDLPPVHEVVLLDGLYGAEGVFEGWLADVLARRDAPRRFVDLYTCCGGTLERSRALADATRPSGLQIFDDDSDSELDRTTLTHRVVFKRVPRAHGALPAAYFRLLLEAADLPSSRPCVR